MRKFNYLKLMELSIPIDIYNTIAKIHEYKGKQELYVENYKDILEKMINVAKIQSTKSSNAIEGIYTNESRLNELMNKKSEPRNRNEEEIAGYRHVLDIVHKNYTYIEFNKNDILTLHNQLYSYSYVNHSILPPFYNNHHSYCLLYKKNFHYKISKQSQMLFFVDVNNTFLQFRIYIQQLLFPVFQQGFVYIPLLSYIGQ